MLDFPGSGHRTNRRPALPESGFAFAVFSVLQVYHLIPFAAVNIEEIELTLETICGRGIYVKTSIHFMHTLLRHFTLGHGKP